MVKVAGTAVLSVGVALVVVAMLWGAPGVEVASWVLGSIGGAVAVVTLLLPLRRDQPTSVGDGRRLPAGLWSFLAETGQRRRPVVVTGVAVLLVLGVLVLWIRYEPPGRIPARVPGTGAEGATGASTAGVRSWPARIANAPRGTFAYQGPFSGTQDRKAVRSLFLDDPLRVLCQERQGRMITDRATGLQSAVWNRLDDDLWVSNLYTDLPQDEAGWARLGIPACTY